MIFHAVGYGGFRASSCVWERATHTTKLVDAFRNFEKRLNT